VQGLALAERLPLLGKHTDQVTLPDRPDDNMIGRDVPVTYVSGDYFSTMRIGLIRGRSFRDAEVPISGERPAVVSAAMARRMWGSADPLGQHFVTGGSRYLVTGVARNTRSVSLADDNEIFAYLSAPPGSARGLRILVRTEGSSTGVEEAMARWAHEFDAALVVHPERLEDRMAEQQKPARVTALVAAALGALALLLAVMGIAGVVGYAVSQRRREIAIRLALGSGRHRVVTMIVRQGAVFVVAGLLVGLSAAAIVSPLLRALLPAVNPFDPLTYLVIGGLLLISVSLALVLPARRAAGIDPAGILRLD
jgi:hypothetical protein